MAVLTSALLRAQFTDESLDLRASIEMARDFWFDYTLNPLKDREAYIMDIVETVTEGVALLIYLLDLEKKKNLQPPVLREVKTLDRIRNDYLKLLVRTVGVGLKNLNAEIEKKPEVKDAVANLNGEHTHTVYQVKRFSVEVLRDRIALANTRIDQTYAEISGGQKKE